MKIQNVTEYYLENATPNKGTFIYSAGYSIKNHRKETAIGIWLYSTLGGDITLLQEASDCGKKTPDYIWNGKAWELKSISSAKAADSALRTAAKQIIENPGGVILELVGEVDIETLEKILSSRFKRVRMEQIDILIKTGDNLKKVLRYKK